MFFVNFGEMYGIVRACPARTEACTASRAVPGAVDRESGSRFPARTRALGSLESTRNRFGCFQFSAKIMIFRKSLEIHDLD